MTAIVDEPAGLSVDLACFDDTSLLCDFPSVAELDLIFNSPSTDAKNAGDPILVDEDTPPLEMIALPAIVLPSKKVSRRKRVEARLRWVREIYAVDRRKLVAGLIAWFRDSGYALLSHKPPYSAVEQLGYKSASFLDTKDARVAVLHRSFPAPVHGFTLRVFDRAGHFPVVFVSSVDGIVDQLKVTSVDHWEDSARRFLPQFDVETEEVRTFEGVKSWGRVRFV